MLMKKPRFSTLVVFTLIVGAWPLIILFAGVVWISIFAAVVSITRGRGGSLVDPRPST